MAHPRQDQSCILDLVVSSGFADFDTLTQLPLVNKAHHKAINERPESLCYWQCLCIASQVKYGLYSRCVHETLHMNAKKYFFDELWTARRKFLTVADSSSTTNASFKIKTSVRIRPGERESRNMQLPLHQFLQVKRRQQRHTAQQLGEDGARKPLVGEQDPEEFLDPFLGTLMKEPVLLPSGAVVDRSVALSFARKGQDPYSARRLTADMLVPQEELRARICEWRKKKCDIDVSVTTGEVRDLIDESAVDPDLLEALLEAESMGKIARRALLDARGGRLGVGADDNFEGGLGFTAEGDENTAPSSASALNAQAGHDSAHGGVFDESGDSAAQPSHGRYVGGDDSGGRWRHGEAARIIDVSETKSCVTMHLPTAGIRPFNFSTCHGASTSQERCYNGSARDMVVAALNGFNSSILCYGQTGSGKTHTMVGPHKAVESEVTPSSGIVMRACRDLLHARERMRALGTEVSLFFQFVEIYDEQATDLLTGKPVSVRRDNGEIVGGSQVEVCSLAEAAAAVNAGQERKKFSETAMNERSSRSHTALIAHILQARSDALVRSQLTLVDLAGSERVKRSKVSGRGLSEAVNINRSLLVLGKVISALVEAKVLMTIQLINLPYLMQPTCRGTCRTSSRNSRPCCA